MRDGASAAMNDHIAASGCMVKGVTAHLEVHMMVITTYTSVFFSGLVLAGLNRLNPQTGKVSSFYLVSVRSGTNLCHVRTTAGSCGLVRSGSRFRGTDEQGDSCSSRRKNTHHIATLVRKKNIFTPFPITMKVMYNFLYYHEIEKHKYSH